MDRACSEQRQNRNANEIIVTILKWRRRSVYPGVNGKIILKCNSKKYDTRV